MSNEQVITIAKFTNISNNTQLQVHFNPESLQYTITNTLKNKGKGNKKKQYVSKSTGKLTMDLVFDTTHNGEDVRLYTGKAAKFMEPTGGNKTPPIVKFEWGFYKFQGMVESYKETTDFFSAKGIPLRASINLTLSAQDKVFESSVSGVTADTADTLTTISAQPLPGRGVNKLATQGNNPSATRSVAESNGVENLRFPGENPIDLNGSPSLKPPTAFTSGSRCFSLGDEGRIGVSLGGAGGITEGDGLSLKTGISTGASSSGGEGISAGVKVGASMSSGVSASAGAFSGLRTQVKASSKTTKINLDKFIEGETTASFGTEDQFSFGLGGQAGLGGSASFKADVGKAGELSAKIQFDGD